MSSRVESRELVGSIRYTQNTSPAVGIFRKGLEYVIKTKGLVYVMTIKGATYKEALDEASSKQALILHRHIATKQTQSKIRTHNCDHMTRMMMMRQFPYYWCFQCWMWMNGVTKSSTHGAVMDISSTVHYDFWSKPTLDFAAVDFLRQFRQTAETLGNTAIFTPHAILFDGINMGCQKDRQNVCGEECTNEGRYCGYSQESLSQYNYNWNNRRGNYYNGYSSSSYQQQDFSRYRRYGKMEVQGVTGANIVKESLRRACIWNTYGKPNGIGIEWWDYISVFMELCNNKRWFNHTKCIHKAYTDAKIDSTLIEQCIHVDSGGLEGNGNNAILDEHLDTILAKTNEQGFSNVMTSDSSIKPIVQVNNKTVNYTPCCQVSANEYHKGLTFEHVFQSICESYIEDNIDNIPYICQRCKYCPQPVLCIERNGTCPGSRHNDIVIVRPDGSSSSHQDSSHQRPEEVQEHEDELEDEHEDEHEDEDEHEYDHEHNETITITSDGGNQCGSSSTMERRDVEITKYIATISSEEDLTTPGSPQNKALQFLLQEEDGPGSACLTNNDDNITSNKHCGNKNRVKNRFLMALLYFSTNGDEWTNCSQNETSTTCDPNKCGGGGNSLFGTKRWLSDSNECDWCGLSCNNIDGNSNSIASVSTTVNGCETTDIYLEGIHQSGVLPYELGLNSNLRQIIIKDGTIGGGLPNEWSNMTNLSTLIIQNQQLEGTLPDMGFEGLHILDLSVNKLTGGISSSFIGNMPSLQVLQLGNNQLSGQFPLEISNLKWLAEIGLENNYLTGTLPSKFGENLVNITVRNNQLLGGISFLSDSTIIPNLVHVDLSNNNLGGNIPNELEGAASLVSFSISNNLFRGEEMPPGMEDLLRPNGNLRALSTDCLPSDKPPVECSFCTLCTENPNIMF